MYRKSRYTPLYHVLFAVPLPITPPQIPPSLKPSPPQIASAPLHLLQVRLPLQRLIPLPVWLLSVLVYSHWMLVKGAPWMSAFFCICSKGHSLLSSCHQQNKRQGLDRCQTPDKNTEHSGNEKTNRRSCMFDIKATGCYGTIPEEGAHRCQARWCGLRWWHRAQARRAIEPRKQALLSEWTMTHSFLWWQAYVCCHFIPLLADKKKISNS